MNATQIHRDQVATILRNWNGSDAGNKADPNVVAEEIDELYRDYIRALPGKTSRIIAGQKAWGRKVV